MQNNPSIQRKSANLTIIQLKKQKFNYYANNNESKDLLAHILYGETDFYIK
jgi:hypothetical protein